MLSRFNGNENILLPVTHQLKDDLLVVAKVTETARTGLPIAEEIGKPPLSALVFYTDAAGASFSMINGEKVFHSSKNRGVACIGGDSIEEAWIWVRTEWPEEFLNHDKDEYGKSYGCKSTTLESIGLLLPFLAFPRQVIGNSLLFMVDNNAVVYAWETGRVKEDQTATEVLKAVGYISAFLGCRVYVKHINRVSNSMAKAADKLSRRPLNDKDEECRWLAGKEAIGSFEGLHAWLRSPVSGISLAQTIINQVEHIMS